MEFPAELRYSSDHEWIRAESGEVTVGITDFAQDALGDVVFVRLPELDSLVKSKQSVGEIESTKSVSDFYAPVSGTVVEVNTELDSSPGNVNADPYGQGWLYRLAETQESEVSELLDASQYQKIVEG